MTMDMKFPILNDEARKLPVFVTSVGGNPRQECMNRTAGFPSWHWLHVSSGSGRLELEGREYFLTHGMGFLMAPGVPHRYESVEVPWSTQWVTFEGHLAGMLTTQMMTASQAVFRLKNPDALEQGIARIHLACSLNNPLQAYEASALLQLFLVTVTRNAVPWDARIPVEGEGGFHEVLRYIEENYHRPLILDEMAKIVHVTPAASLPVVPPARECKTGRVHNTGPASKGKGKHAFPAGLAVAQNRRSQRLRRSKLFFKAVPSL